MKRLDPRRWSIMSRFEVPDLDHPWLTYLTRWRILQTPLFGIYLHRMDGPDSRLTLHDHPWPFVSLVLRGGYFEHRDYDPDFRATHIRRVNVKRATDVHAIQRLERTPTWTLMLTGRRRRRWGYVDPDGTWTASDEHPHSEEFAKAMAWRRDYWGSDK